MGSPIYFVLYCLSSYWFMSVFIVIGFFHLMLSSWLGSTFLKWPIFMSRGNSWLSQFPEFHENHPVTRSNHTHHCSSHCSSVEALTHTGEFLCPGILHTAGKYREDFRWRCGKNGAGEVSVAVRCHVGQPRQLCVESQRTRWVFPWQWSSLAVQGLHFVSCNAVITLLIFVLLLEISNQSQPFLNVLCSSALVFNQKPGMHYSVCCAIFAFIICSFCSALFSQGLSLVKHFYGCPM